jgi:hypothetical protein
MNKSVSETTGFESLKSSSTLRNALIACVAALGVAVFVVGAFMWSSEDVSLLLFLAGLTVLSEFVDFGPFANSRVSVSIVLIFAAGAFSGLPGAVLVAAVSAVADTAAHRKPLYKSAFNLGVLVITGAVYVGVVSALSQGHDSHDWAALLGPSMAGALVAFAVNSGLVTLVISLDRHMDVFSIWNDSFRWLLPHYVVLGLLAILMALAYDRWGMGGMALFLVPLAMAWLAMKQYADSAERIREVPTGTPA